VSSLETRIEALERQLDPCPSVIETARAAEWFYAKLDSMIASTESGAPIAEREYAEWLIARRVGQSLEWRKTWKPSHGGESPVQWIARFFRQRGYRSFPRDYKLSVDQLNENA